MYDVSQFKTALYAVVLLGLSGYALAAESPGLWVFALALILANAWLVRQGTFRPIPRVAANAVTVVAFLFALGQLRSHSVDSPILAIGQFLVLLQVVKLWEQRANRDYAQLLVLSLLLMVAAAISTASLLFGLVFVGYVLASLYCCLLFHLKVETEQARAAAELPANVDPSAGRAAADRPDRAAAERRGLSASMRRLTGLISAYSMVAAVVVFLFFPRGPGAGVFGQYQWKPRNTLVGFSEQVNFQQVARITQNDDQVGTLRIIRNGQPLPSAGTLLLRGYTDDYYSGSAGGDDGGPGKYAWSHGPGSTQPWWRPMIPEREGGTWRPPAIADDSAGVVHQEIDLSPTGTQALFSVAGPVLVRVEDPNAARRLRLAYGQFDGTLRNEESIAWPVRYTVDSTGELGDETPAPGRGRSVIDPAIGRFARDRDVTGGLAADRDRLSLARPDRGADGYVSPLDQDIASRIESYLKHHYAYTLDLSSVDQVAGRDPMVAFLTDFKKGHCEYFAGAMTLLCQSLGMEARMVIGFRVDDYNQFGHYYTIRQSQAHTWVEVRTTHGWVSYDPTGGSESLTQAVSAWQRTKNFVDFLEYTWQRAVIAYNSDNRDNLIQAVDSRLPNPNIKPASLFNGIEKQLHDLGDRMAQNVVGPIVGLLVLAMLGTVGWFAVDRYRMRRRAARIGLGDLPADAQARLVRQLAFYDGLVQLLARHKINRPPHLTPLEFSQTLSFLPPNAYELIGRLTGVFYRIRFGGAEVDDGRQRRLGTMVGRLEGMMPAGTSE